jgi:hypothetical protein
LGQAAPPRISIRQNRFSLLDSAGNATMIPTFNIDVVIADANPNVSKMYYDEAYDPQASEHAAPACWSDNGLAPSASAAKPQNDRCATCPHAEWGSAVSKVSGKGTKACTDFKKLAVLVVHEGFRSETPYLLQVPPASLKHLRSYAETLSNATLGQRAVDMSDVVTRITFDPAVQGVLNFTPVGWADEATFAILDKLEATPEVTARLVGLDDKPASAHPVPAVGQAPAAPRIAAPVPELTRTVETAPPAAAPAAEAPKPPRARKAAPPPPPAPVAAQAAPQAPEIPAFLQRQAPPPVAPAQPQFGLATAQAPDAGLSAALDSVFRLPTGN